jgi:hypothetical protein
MSLYAILDPVVNPPRPIDEPFALAARRITATWLDTREVVATLDDLRLATSFLLRSGVTVEPMPACQVRIVSEQGLTTVTSREAAVMMAIRSLVALDARYDRRSIARAA